MLAALLGTRRARLVAWLLGAVPALWCAWQLWRAYSGEPHALGREPVKGLEHATGNLTIRFLAATLLVTPLRQLTGWNWLARYRRICGLLAFAYATAHLATYVVLDLELVWGDVGRELVKRPYIAVGFTAWLLLVPLALTSTAASIRRLGKGWNTLHRLTYAVVVLGLLHFWWSQKKDHSEPLIWGLVFAALFAWRLWRRYSSTSTRSGKWSEARFTSGAS